MHSCNTDGPVSRVSRYSHWSKQPHSISQAYCLDNLKIVESSGSCVCSLQDMIHTLAYLKAMFLPSPLLCSVFLRLRDRLGTRAWTTDGSKTATVSRALYTCLSYTPSFSSTNDLGALGMTQTVRAVKDKADWSSPQTVLHQIFIAVHYF